MSNIRTVADDAGVSIATVSRVLNQQAGVSDRVREIVLESAQRCGYTPARARRQANLIALVYTGPSTVASPYDAAVLEGMWESVADSELDIVLVSLQRDKKVDESFTQYFYRKGIRAVVVRTTASNRDVCLQIARERFPAVVVGDRFDGDAVSFVHADSRGPTRQAIEHLLTLGHQRIGIAFSMIDDTDHLDRLEAYRETLESHGIPYDPKLCLRVPARYSDGAQVVRWAMSCHDRPTAIFVADPPVAIGAMNEAQRLGVQIPGDLSIVGVDDQHLRTQIHPAMTAVCQDARQLGTEAIGVINDLLQAGTRAGPIRRSGPTWFEIHESTGTPPANARRVLQDGTALSNAHLNGLNGQNGTKGTNGNGTA